METIYSFYSKVIHDLIKDKDASILVCGGSVQDMNVFKNLGFRNVVISNLGQRARGYDYTPYVFELENVESLSYPDESFDYVIIHLAIHHTQLPHKALTEMFRVASKGLIAFESNDSSLIRLAEKFGFTQEYRVAGVFPGDGVNATNIPTHIYRWTEREIEKTIKSYSPCFKHKFIYRYVTIYPNGPDLSSSKRLFIKLLYPFFFLFFKVFPRQQNHFAFYIEKPTIQNSLLPWLFFDSNSKRIEVNYNWIAHDYIRLKNRRT